MKKPLIALVLLVVLALGAWAWMHQRNQGHDDALVLHGNVDIRQIALAFDGSGRVAELRAEEGDRVNAGVVLGVLDTRTLALQAEQAQAQIGVQQQTLLRLRNGCTAAGNRPGPEPCDCSPGDAAQAEQDLQAPARHRRQHPRARRQRAGSGPRQKPSAGRPGQGRGATRSLASDRTGTARGGRGGRRGAAQGGAGATGLAAAPDRSGRTQGARRRVVRSRLLEPGDMATPQKPVLALALTQPKWVRVYVGEPDLGRVRPGMEARVSRMAPPASPSRARSATSPRWPSSRPSRYRLKRCAPAFSTSCAYWSMTRRMCCAWGSRPPST
jgi:HlyD family secretion protein